MTSVHGVSADDAYDMQCFPEEAAVEMAQGIFVCTIIRCSVSAPNAVIIVQSWKRASRVGFKAVLVLVAQTRGVTKKDKFLGMTKKGKKVRLKKGHTEGVNKRGTHTGMAKRGTQLLIRPPASWWQFHVMMPAYLYNAIKMLWRHFDGIMLYIVWWHNVCIMPSHVVMTFRRHDAFKSSDNVMVFGRQTLWLQMEGIMFSWYLTAKFYYALEILWWRIDGIILL